MHMTELTELLDAYRSTTHLLDISLKNALFQNVCAFCMVSL
jgi:hypothetical protein